MSCWTLENAKDLLTIVASIAATFFFGWKIFTGWLIENLELTIEATRQACEGGEDWFSYKVIFKKGNIDTLWLKDVQMKIYAQQDQRSDFNKTFNLTDKIHRFKIEKKSITWSASKKKLTLSPGESFHIGAPLKVPANTALIAEVAVFGNRPFWRKKGFQWRASVASLPVKM